MYFGRQLNNRGDAQKNELYLRVFTLDELRLSMVGTDINLPLLGEMNQDIPGFGTIPLIILYVYKIMYCSRLLSSE